MKQGLVLHSPEGIPQVGGVKVITLQKQKSTCKTKWSLKVTH